MTAIDVPTRLIITYWIGGRELEDARQMFKDLAGRCVDKPLFVSDELSHYGTVMGELFHELIPAEPTGKPGRSRNPHKVIDADLDYATVHKTREGGKVIKVERNVVHGSEPRILERLEKSPSQVINTAYIVVLVKSFENDVSSFVTGCFTMTQLVGFRLFTMPSILSARIWTGGCGMHI